MRKAELPGRILKSYKDSAFVFPVGWVVSCCFFCPKVSLFLAIFYSCRQQLHLSSHLRKFTGLSSYFPDIWVSPHVTRTLVGSDPTTLNHGVMVSVGDISNAKATRLNSRSFETPLHPSCFIRFLEASYYACLRRQPSNNFTI